MSVTMAIFLLIFKELSQIQAELKCFDDTFLRSFNLMQCCFPEIHKFIIIRPEMTFFCLCKSTYITRNELFIQ